MKIKFVHSTHSGCPKEVLLEKIPEINEIFVYAESDIETIYKASFFATLQKMLSNAEEDEIKHFIEDQFCAESQPFIFNSFDYYKKINAIAFSVTLTEEDGIQRKKMSIHEALIEESKILERRIEEIKLFRKIRKFRKFRKVEHEEIVFINCADNEKKFPSSSPPTYEELKKIERLGVYKIKKPNKRSFESGDDNDNDKYQRQNTYKKQLRNINDELTEVDVSISSEKKIENIEKKKELEEFIDKYRANHNKSSRSDTKIRGIMKENNVKIDIGTIGSIGQSGGYSNASTNKTDPIVETPKKIKKSRKRWWWSFPVLGLLSLIIAWIKVLSTASVMVSPLSNKDYLYFEITPEPFLTTCEYRINSEPWTQCGKNNKSYYFIKKKNGINVALFLFGIIRVRNFGDIADIKRAKAKS